MKKYILSALLLIPALMLLAVFDDYQPSARARGMGNAYTGVANDASAIFYNPAGLTGAGYELKFGYANLFNQKFTEYKTMAVTTSLPFKLGNLGLGTRMYDVDFEDTSLMSEQIWSLSHGFNLVKDIHSTISFGYTANIYRLSFENEDSDTAVGFDVGGMAILHQRTRFGFSVSNLNNPKMGDTNQNELPRRMAMGIAYVPYEGVTTSIEMKKDFAKETEFMGGVESRLFESLSIRAGVHSNPATWSAGASFYLSGISLDYSYTHHAVLDGTHYLNLGYVFTKPNWR
ncbi:MAG: hypothetical protein U1C33_04455 [Candidatus Cloacimonadaceae bacterium]|nr:hypothetical protein [Candidatus Cloacimonadaceae bacterium]